MDHTSLYDEDVYAWSEAQANVLRRLAKSAHILPNDLDLDHVIEEIEDVGNSERNAAASFIRLIFVHLIKLWRAPDSPAAKHWRSEIVGFHNELLGRLTKSMRGAIDLDLLWKRARKEAALALEAQDADHGRLLQEWGGSPLTIEELAAEDFNVESALGALDSRSETSSPA